jgi:hypothetical protein
MANIKYFSGTTEVFWPYPMPNQKFAAQFPDIKGIRSDSFSRFVGETTDKVLMPITRKIEFKSNPSLHKCDARCRSAKGRSCECSCGGKYHGAGDFSCEATN